MELVLSMVMVIEESGSSTCGNTAVAARHMWSFERFLPAGCWLQTRLRRTRLGSHSSAHLLAGL